jgi:hypothetical protein
MNTARTTTPRPVVLTLLRPRETPAPAVAEPLDTFATHHYLNGAWGTTVTRVWEERRFPTCGGLCEPASECTFRNGVCQVGVSGYVPAASCPRLAKRPEPR